MSIKKVLASICATALVAGFSASASAETILLSIPTNFGKGADTEIREEETDTGFSGFAGRNRGGNTVAVGTRARTKNSSATLDSTYTGTNSSAQYMKFDISQLPVSSDPYWNGKSVWFRANTVGTWRAYSVEAAALPNPIPRTEFVWRLRALNPSGTYNNGVNGQTDLNGNPYTASQYLYDWTEGTGTGAAADVTGITAYNAPGIRPFCKTAACATANGNSLG